MLSSEARQQLHLTEQDLLHPKVASALTSP
jgi:hypothetical protein